MWSKFYWRGYTSYTLMNELRVTASYFSWYKSILQDSTLITRSKGLNREMDLLDVQSLNWKQTNWEIRQRTNPNKENNGDWALIWCKPYLYLGMKIMMILLP